MNSLKGNENLAKVHRLSIVDAKLLNSEVGRGKELHGDKSWKCLYKEGAPCVSV